MTIMKIIRKSLFIFSYLSASVADVYAFSLLL
jgi:hypothetical protein